MSPLKTFFLAALFALFSGVLVSCADGAATSPDASSGPATSSLESTRQGPTSLPALESSGPEASLLQSTTGLVAARPPVVLRVEGSPGARFSGVCDSGGDRSVLSGQVPERFTFRPGLSCRIQNQSRKGESLRVVLVESGKTRSVQQTDVPGGTIQVSYGG